MNTEEYQQTLIHLIKNPEARVSTEPYFEQLSNSIELEIARDISVWWRCLQLEKFCVLTSQCIKAKNNFDEVVREFYLQTNISPYIEIAAQQFLEHQTKEAADSWVRQVAEFEYNLVRIKRGNLEFAELKWEYNPYDVFQQLLQSKAINENVLQNGTFTIRFNKELEGSFEVFQDVVG